MKQSQPHEFDPGGWPKPKEGSHMTAVYIRHELWAEGAFLAEVPFDQIGTIIPALHNWGLMDNEGADLSGQFVYEADKRKAYFEVVVSDAEVSA